MNRALTIDMSCLTKLINILFWTCIVGTIKNLDCVWSVLLSIDRSTIVLDTVMTLLTDIMSDTDVSSICAHDSSQGTYTCVQYHSIYSFADLRLV